MKALATLITVVLLSLASEGKKDDGDEGGEGFHGESPWLGCAVMHVTTDGDFFHSFKPVTFRDKRLGILKESCAFALLADPKKEEQAAGFLRCS